MKKLRDTVSEAVKIAEECPENLRQICFEILLKHLLAGKVQPSKPLADRPKDDAEQEKPEPKSVVEKSAKEQEDLSDKDVHLKVRRFLEKYGATLDHLNQLFYKEGEEIMPLFDDLKTTRTSESQIRITLLQCLNTAIQEGNFRTTVEAVREEAKIRKCLDAGNWGNNYTNNAALFDFDKYTKKVTTISLSDNGKQELADLIKALQ